MESGLLGAAEIISLGGVAVPLLGRANIWVEDSVETRESVGLTQSVIEGALAATQAGQLELLVFDDGLTGVSAPFESVNAGGEKLLQVTHDEGEFRDMLTFLRDHVQSVNNVIQGLAPNLVEFRKEVRYPVEGYKLVVLSTDVSLLSEELQNHLSILLRAGPRAGVSFLIHSVKLGVEFLAELCEVLSVRAGAVRYGGNHAAPGWTQPPARRLIAAAKDVAAQLATSAMDPIEFASVEHSPRWSHSSADGLTFAVGRYGLSTVEITLGDELNQRHNMLITGAVGQGKSNLLSVIIHSLGQRFSPQEVELYLLDFKEGVTLQTLFDRSSGVYFPHARVLGLEADREFGLSVLEHLFQIYRERMATFKSSGVQNIRQYRELGDDYVMPRILLVIDEFQIMFADKDRLSDSIAAVLVRGARLFRACGIHIILASQTIGGNLALMGSTGEGLFGQVPVRVALKNSLAESHATLGVRNDAAAHLRAREAIVNVDYGELSANRKTTIAFADERVLGPLRASWWTDASHRRRVPFVFEGDRLRQVTEDLPALEGLAAEGRHRYLLLGQKIQVHAAPLVLPFPGESGRNVAVVGGSAAAQQLLNIGLGLALQRGAGEAEFVVLDCLEPQEEWSENLAAFTGRAREERHQVRIVSKDDLAEEVRQLGERVQSGEARRVYVLGFGLERCREMPVEFPDLVRTGPSSGVQVLAWWRKFESFRDHVGYGGDAYFDTKIALRLDVQTVRQFFNDPLLDWQPRENRALVWDSSEMTQPVGVIPYAKFEPGARVGQASDVT